MRLTTITVNRAKELLPFYELTQNTWIHKNNVIWLYFISTYKTNIYQYKYINVYFYYSPFIIFILEYTKYIITCNNLYMEQNTYIM